MFTTADDPIVEVVSCLRERYSDSYQIVSTPLWWYFKAVESKSPSQGWKIHLSVIPADAILLLEATGEWLLRQQVNWKVCRSLDLLAKLCSPPTPVSQVGKFMTIYPATEEQALELAKFLHSKTHQFAGPVIPSDRQYVENSLVYFRYGSFEMRYFYDSDEAMKFPYILKPDGERVLDGRKPGKYCPDWVSDPFLPLAPSAPADPSEHGLFGKHIFVKGLFNQSAKGGVYFVTQGEAQLVLKEGRFGTCGDRLRRDSRDRLTNEFQILRKLSPLGVTPKPLELFDRENNRYLLLEYIPGQPLRSYVEEQNYRGNDEVAFIRLICTSLIDLVEKVHAEGVIIRDLSPGNVLVTRDGCKLIDLELAYLAGCQETPFSGHTPGYIPFGTEREERTSPEYDLYALGALLFFILTGIDPYLPGVDLVSRREQLLTTFLRSEDLQDIADVASTYMAWRGYAQGNVATSSAREEASILSHETGAEFPTGVDLPFDFAVVKENAVAVADELYATANWESAEQLWASPMGEKVHPASFQCGSTGVAWYFSEIAQVTGETKYLAYAEQIMDWTLKTHPFSPGTTPPGLNFGYASIPWMLARLAEGTGQQEYLERARELAHIIMHTPTERLDITHGRAGIGLMCLEIYRRTGDERLLAQANTFAQQIVEQAVEDAQGITAWERQGKHAWGFAHGAAGIAYYLLAASVYTADARYKELAERVGRSLLRVALTTVQGRGLTWTRDDASTITWTHWCNGASGVGSFFLLASQLLHNPDFEYAAIQAANTVRFGHGFGACGQCHGLAGDGDYLVQVRNELARDEFTPTIHTLARKLYALRLQTEGKPGWIWPGEGDGTPIPDYMTGYCGVYSFLLRIFQPGLHRPFAMHF